MFNLSNNFQTAFCVESTCFNRIVKYICAVFTLSIATGCGSKSIPPCPSKLDANNIKHAPLMVELPRSANELSMQIVGLRNGKMGLYLDVLVVGNNAEVCARYLSGSLAMWKHELLFPMEWFHIYDVRRDKTIQLLRPEVKLGEYSDLGRPIWAFFATGNQVTEEGLSVPGYMYTLPESDYPAVIQTFVVRTDEQMLEGEYDVRILDNICNFANQISIGHIDPESPDLSIDNSIHHLFLSGMH